jgi:lambda family phage tail tape measure protein
VLTTFGGVLASIGLSTFILSLADAAGAIKDLSENFGLTLESTLELRNAFTLAGKSSEDMGKVLSTLKNTALDAAGGNKELILAYKTLGISMKDLETQSPIEIMSRIASVMQNANGSATLLAASNDILGKTVKNMPWGDFVTGLENSKGKMGALATSTREWDKASEEAGIRMTAIRDQAMIALTPIATKFNELTKSADAAKAVAYGLIGAFAILGAALVITGITAVVNALKALASAFGIGAIAAGVEAAAVKVNTSALVASYVATAALMRAKVAQLQVEVATQTALVASTVGTTANAAATRNLEKYTWRLAVAKASLAGADAAVAASATATTAAVAGTTVAMGAATIATRVLTIALAALALVTKPVVLVILAAAAAIGGLYYAWQKFSGGAKDASENVADVGENARKTAEALKAMRLADQNVPWTDPPKPEDESVLDAGSLKAAAAARAEAMKGAAQAGKANADSLREQYRQQDENNRLIKERLQLQLQSVGKTEEEKNLLLAKHDAEATKLQEIGKLQSDISKVRAQMANEEHGGVKYGEQLRLMQDRLKFLQTEKDETVDLAEKVRVATVEHQRQLERNQWLKTMESTAQQDVLNSTRELMLLTATDHEKKMANLRAEIQGHANLEIARRQALTPDTPISQEEQISIIERVNQAYQPLLDTVQQLNDKSREFQTGWDTALNKFMEQAGNHADLAGDVFNKMTSTINSAVDELVSTGKVNFKSLATSVIKDLMAMTIKALIFRTIMSGLGGGSGGFGAISGIGSLGDIFGMGARAMGGSVGGNKPYIVGEKGPELFIPGSNGTVIPNRNLQQNTQPSVNNVQNINVSAIDGASVAKFFLDNRQLVMMSNMQAPKDSR